jgi:MFS transporter, PHS family, inorganic phosphate transporter
MKWNPVALHVKNRTANFDHITVRSFITVYSLRFTFSNTSSSKQDLRLRRRRVLDALDRTHFQWLVVFVAGVGFLADGYDVFPVQLSQIQLQ